MRRCGTTCARGRWHCRQDVSYGDAGATGRQALRTAGLFARLCPGGECLDRLCWCRPGSLTLGAVVQ
eukprot:2961354-Pyramimonas_sp.AAC.1